MPEENNITGKLLAATGTSAIGRYGLLPFVLCILLCWLIIPIFIFIGILVKNGSYSYFIYEKCVILEYGVISNHQDRKMITKVLNVNLDQSTKGSIFGYGTVRISLLGQKLGMALYNIKDPEYIKSVFEKMMVDPDTINQVITSV